jgi:hypothetical protein
MLKKTIRSIIGPVRKALQGEAIFTKPSRTDAVTIKTAEKLNADYPRTRRGTVITVPKNPIITAQSKVFAIGSCFAMEIRAALKKRGIDVTPRYYDIKFDPLSQSLAGLPKHDDINHYDTFTILREFEMAFGVTKPAPNTWTVTSPGIKLSIDIKSDTLYQDPRRKRIFAATPDALSDLVSKVDSCIAAGIRDADIFIITLGLIETWRDKKTGQNLCMPPGKDQMNDSEFVFTGFQENFENMRRVCALIRDHAPGKKIILTVSPVPLGKTFTGRDIVVANMESKSLLRTVAGQIAREFGNVIYWPSYEIAMREDMFEDDGRHVTKSGVDKIIGAFMDAHLSGNS